VLNERAVAVMTRMSDKLMGRDYAAEGVPGPTESHSVPAQARAPRGRLRAAVKGWGWGPSQSVWRWQMLC
jgi:hypothetical protein